MSKMKEGVSGSGVMQVAEGEWMPIPGSSKCVLFNAHKEGCRSLHNSNYIS